MTTEFARMMQHRNTAAGWTADNPVLLAGEIGVDTTAGAHRVGDGVTAWSSLPVFANRTTLNAAYVPKGRLGNLVVFLGDSVTAGADDVAGNARGSSWPVYASIGSGQKVKYVRNAGVPGDKTSQMLARFDTDVTPYNPSVVTIAGGTNDTGVTDYATWQNAIIAIIAKVVAIGAVPVLVTMPPNNLTTPTPDRRYLIVEWNAWLRRYATEQGIPLIDFYQPLVDPITGLYQTAYYNDGTHPNEAGKALLGTVAAAVLTPLVAAIDTLITQSDADEANSITNGCFASASGTAVPARWTDNAGVPTGSALSYTTDSQVKGNLLTVTSTASSAQRQIMYQSRFGTGSVSTTATLAGDTAVTLDVNPYSLATLYIGTGATAEAVKVQSVSGFGPTWTATLVRGLRYAHAIGEQIVVNGAPGDTMSLSAKVTSDGNIEWGVACNANVAGGGGAAYQLFAAFTRGVVNCEWVVPALVTDVYTNLNIYAGTGVVSFGQVSLYNLTRMAVLTP